MTGHREGNLDGILQLIIGDNSIGGDEESGLCSFATMHIDGVETVFRVNYKLASANALSVEAVWMVCGEKLVLLWPNSSVDDDCSNNLVQAFSLFDQLMLVFFGSMNKIARVVLFSDLVKGHYLFRRRSDAVKTILLKISVVKAMGIENEDIAERCLFTQVELEKVPRCIQRWQYESLNSLFLRCVGVPAIDQFALRNEIALRSPERIIFNKRFFVGRNVKQNELRELKVLPGDYFKLIIEGDDNPCKCVSVFHDPQTGGINILPESVFDSVYA